jgi:hypothetical protein
MLLSTELSHETMHPKIRPPQCIATSAPPSSPRGRYFELPLCVGEESQKCCNLIGSSLCLIYAFVSCVVKLAPSSLFIHYTPILFYFFYGCSSLLAAAI